MYSPLVTTAWLETHLHDVSLRIIDIRGRVLPASQPPPHYFSHRAAYNEAHIPNAVFIDWQVDIVEPDSPSNDIASAARFAELMGRLGIDSATTVVAYDDAASMFAARLWWSLRYYGHAPVYILDGGWHKWIAEGRLTDRYIPQYEQKAFLPRINPKLKASAEDILESIETEALQLIDVRSPPEFAGEASRAQYAGHIPTAINLPRKAMVADDMTLKPVDDLKNGFSNAGIDLDANDTVLYCNSGVSACFGLLALEAAGARHLRIYDGSWKEWGNDAAKPIETAK